MIKVFLILSEIALKDLTKSKELLEKILKVYSNSKDGKKVIL